MPQQLTLNMRLNDDARLDNFFVSDANRQMLSALTQALIDRAGLFYLYGQLGVGRSHLLQACCHRLAEQQGSAQYLPLVTLVDQTSPDILEGMEYADLICIDDVDTIAGNSEWEEALFHLYNRAREQSRLLVMAGCAPPAQLDLDLADLQSRLQHTMIYKLANYSDDDLKHILQLRAEKRGFNLKPDVLQFIIYRASRDTHQLMQLFNQLDELSLQQQRVLTIPFLKQVLGW